jgi:hypothetical protein
MRQLIVHASPALMHLPTPPPPPPPTHQPRPIPSASFAFAVYFTREAANQAVEKLNGQTLGTRTIKATLSTTANNRLFIGNVPRTLTNAQLRDALAGDVPGERGACLECRARCSTLAPYGSPDRTSPPPPDAPLQPNHDQPQSQPTAPLKNQPPPKNQKRHRGGRPRRRPRAAGAQPRLRLPHLLQPRGGRRGAAEAGQQPQARRDAADQRVVGGGQEGE